MLLFDANPSPKLVGLVADAFPGSTHAEIVGLTSPDRSIWDYCARSGLAIVTKDGDFEALAMVLAPPGEVILVKIGNCKTSLVQELLREARPRIDEFLASANETLLVLA